MPLILDIIVVLCKIGFYYWEALYRKIVPLPPKDITGQLVLITGGGKGIGRSQALEFAKQGARVALWDIDQKGNEETAALVKNQGGDAHAYTCDITKLEKVRETANQVRRDMGEVDILVNNAGIMICKNLMDLTEGEIRRTFEINSIAQFWTVQTFLPAMLERDSGHIVNIASMAGRHGNAMLTDYCASKFAVVGFSDALQAELQRMKKEGVKVSVVCPMGVNTNLITSVSDRVEFRDKQNGVMEPDDVAAMIVNGVRRNAGKIFCPDHMKNTVLMSEMIPRKAVRMMGEFLETGFFPTKEGKAE